MEKKTSLPCLGLLNHEDLNPWGHTAGLTWGDWRVTNGRFWGGQKIETVCVVLKWGDVVAEIKTHLDVVRGKSRLRHLEAKRCPVRTGSCANKSLCYGSELLEQLRKSNQLKP